MSAGLSLMAASPHPPAWTPNLLNLARTSSLLAPVSQSMAQNVPRPRVFLRYCGNLLSRSFNPDRRISPVARVLTSKSSFLMVFRTASRRISCKSTVLGIKWENCGHRNRGRMSADDRLHLLKRSQSYLARIPNPSIEDPPRLFWSEFWFMIETPCQHLLAEGDNVWRVLQVKPLMAPHSEMITSLRRSCQR